MASADGGDRIERSAGPTCSPGYGYGYGWSSGKVKLLSYEP